MKRRMTWAAAAFLVFTGSIVASADVQRWWRHVTYLADGKLEGRETGSPGHKQAAAYVTAEFERAGLKPGGVNGYIQPVRFRSRRIVEAQSSLALVRDGKAEPVVLGDEATFSMRIEPAAVVEAPVVFIGHGLQIPEKNYDDLAGVDLHGKVVMALGGGPPSIPGPLMSHSQSTRWRALHAAGAIGVITLQNPKGQDIPWDRSKLSRLLPSMALADSSLDETVGQKLAVTVNPAVADKFLAGSGHAFKELLELADAGKPLPHFPLPYSVRAKVAFEASDVESQNIVGILPGTDPSLRDQYVVLSAHVDHLGVGQFEGGKRVYPGAMDNASGVATLIEAADRLREAGKKLRRPVIFLAITAEEQGLLGSRYYAAHPTVPAGSLVANVNVDMPLPLFPLKSLIVQGLEESDLAGDLRRVAGAAGIQVLSDPEPERNAFIRSDQYSFIRRGIPALSLKVGFMKGSPEHETVKRWRTERYHAPADDLAQPVDLGAADDFVRVYTLVVEAIANRADRPKWNADSFFRRFATSESK